jgi:hypothetical protein
MNEGPPQRFERRNPKEKLVALAKELSQSGEQFPFSGIGPEAYSKMKATDEEYPGYTTPIDELIERFENEGMKVVLGTDPESGNVFILPSQSDDIAMDSISPKQLTLNEEMDSRIKELILLSGGQK